MSTLLPLLQAADAQRTALLAQLHDENTNAYRLFHGSVEGRDGLTIDRYGDVLLIQTFHTPLSDEEHQTILDHYAPLGLHAVNLQLQLRCVFQGVGAYANQRFVLAGCS